MAARAAFLFILSIHALAPLTPRRNPVRRAAQSVDATEESQTSAAGAAHAIPDLAAAANAALDGDAAPLRDLLAPSVQWSNPIGDAKSASEALALVAEAAAFFEAPRLDVYSATEEHGAVTYDWVASGGWPVKWAPRVSFRGRSVATLADGRIARLEDAWDAKPGDVVARQVAPRFWDLYDLWATPTAERPQEVELGTLKLPSGGRARVLRTPPRLAVVASVLDVSNSRKRRVASALPDFAFGVDTKDPTRGATTTTPLEVVVEALPRAPNATRTERRVTWTVPAPSRLGLDPAAPDLPPLDEIPLEDVALELGYATTPRLSYALTPARTVVAAPYGGDV
eukprot:CAMPEP_0119272520 /NCGR_PEP_ID=MMETSP1329-20130426/8659_1 /TAXON_ID=114041 /ORGANISM="Genus nov. species nov., Strain RCC1024" /LENGTH=339 /DNA_ID=CAMNT_0007272587 /DNA_START=75 /DNA_END=1091 /DNA_ORIENTATION=+